MMDRELSEETKKVLLTAGAVLVGIGDMSEVANCPLPVGVAVAVPVPADIVKSLKNAPTKEYYDTYHFLNDKLDKIIDIGKDFLTAKGYHVIAQTRKAVKLDRTQWISPLPHKTIATRAGIGWIGKNCLLVTQEYGAAIRISSLLTDAPLECNQPIDISKCGECRLCVKACPGQALTGINWEKHMKREQIIDVHKCYETQKRIMFENTGIDYDLCGKCFAMCTYTQIYLKNLSLSERNGIKQ